MALHDTAPMVAGIDGRRRRRLAADRGRIDENVSALKRHDARGFRKPLIPANRRAKIGAARRKAAEAGVAGMEIIFFLISGTVGNMRFAIAPDDVAVGVNDR